MRSKKGIGIYKQSVVNVVILLAIFALFAYFTVQFAQNFSTAVSTQRAQRVTDTEFVYLDGYVFRNESVLAKDAGGICDYLVGDGERVGVHQPYAVFYSMDGQSKDKITETQSMVNDLSDRIARLRSGASMSGTVSSMAHVNETLSTSYYSYVDSVLKGDFLSADTHGDLVLGALVNYSVITGRDGVAESISSSLSKEKQDLLNGIGVSGETLVSEEGFYFFRNADGYEGIFNTDVLDTLTPQALNELAGRKAEKYGAEVIGRMIHSTRWCVALPANEATCLLFSVGFSYDITFSGEGNKTVSMMLENICLDENGDGYLLFSSRDLSAAGNFDRDQSVKIKMGTVSGYKVPSGALATVNGERGVYVLVGNVVHFKRVMIIGEGHGYYVVATYEDAQSEGSVSDTPYLNINDLIISSGNDLYDGKLID